MKITRSKIPARRTEKASNVTRNSATQHPSSPTPSAPVKDVIEIAGIPEAELTPKVRRALTELMGEVQSLRQEVSQLKTRLTEAEIQADHDALLNIPNRRAFVRDLSRALAMAERHETKAALIFIDLNDLKTINDTFGHAAGDAALKHLADLVSTNIRATDSFARLGGDEFGMILMNTDRTGALIKVKQITSLAMQSPFVWKTHRQPLEMACGVIELKRGLSVEQALEEADQAMYQDKGKGRSFH